jgi:hypothetical protein
MRNILLRVPGPLKAKLDAKRGEGYCINRLIVAVLERELADPPKPRRKSKQGT